MEEIETLYKKSFFFICVQFAVYEKEDNTKKNRRRLFQS